MGKLYKAKVILDVDVVFYIDDPDKIIENIPNNFDVQEEIEDFGKWAIEDVVEIKNVYEIPGHWRPARVPIFITDDNNHGSSIREILKENNKKLK